MRKVVVSWSGGKDSAYALHKIIGDNHIQIEGLLTTISSYDRSSIHGIREELIEKQSEETKIPVKKVKLPENCSDQNYRETMSQVMKDYKKNGIESIVFADIFLEDVREYREENLSSINIDGYWPLWGKDTSKIVRNFIEEGFKAIIVSVDGSKLDKSFAGRELNQEFLKDLPSDVDDCGENGEYHTFVWDGPIFENQIRVKKGKIVEREIEGTTFYYCDLKI